MQSQLSGKTLSGNTLEYDPPAEPQHCPLPNPLPFLPAGTFVCAFPVQMEMQVKQGHLCWDKLSAEQEQDVEATAYQLAKAAEAGDAGAKAALSSLASAGSGGASEAKRLGLLAAAQTKAQARLRAGSVSEQQASGGDTADAPDMPEQVVWRTEFIAKHRPTEVAFLAQAMKESGAVQTESGLVIVALCAGSGKSPTISDTVEVHYEGALMDGSIFDSSVQRGESASFPLSSVIKGWREGLQLMKEGGKAKMTIPCNLAYGDDGSPPKIPPGATLVFQVELIAVK